MSTRQVNAIKGKKGFQPNPKKTTPPSPEDDRNSIMVNPTRDDIEQRAREISEMFANFYAPRQPLPDEHSSLLPLFARNEKVSGIISITVPASIWHLHAEVEEEMSWGLSPKENARLDRTVQYLDEEASSVEIFPSTTPLSEDDTTAIRRWRTLLASGLNGATVTTGYDPDGAAVQTAVFIDVPWTPTIESLLSASARRGCRVDGEVCAEDGTYALSHTADDITYRSATEEYDDEERD